MSGKIIIPNKDNKPVGQVIIPNNKYKLVSILTPTGVKIIFRDKYLNATKKTGGK